MCCSVDEQVNWRERPEFPHKSMGGCAAREKPRFNIGASIVRVSDVKEDLTPRYLAPIPLGSIVTSVVNRNDAVVTEDPGKLFPSSFDMVKTHTKEQYCQIASRCKNGCLVGVIILEEDFHDDKFGFVSVGDLEGDLTAIHAQSSATILGYKSKKNGRVFVNAWRDKIPAADWKRFVSENSGNIFGEMGPEIFFWVPKNQSRPQVEQRQQQML
jgi:hypothetical protein